MKRRLNRKRCEICNNWFIPEKKATHWVCWRVSCGREAIRRRIRGKKRGKKDMEYGRNELEYAVFESKEPFMQFCEQFWDACVSKRPRKIFVAACPLDAYFKDSEEDLKKIRKDRLDRKPNQIVGEIPGRFTPLFVINDRGGFEPVQGVSVSLRILRKGPRPSDLGMEPFEEEDD